MSVKTYCLALILILTAAWTYDLQGRAHVIVVPPGVSPFEQAFVPFSIKQRAELSQQIEAPFHSEMDLLEVDTLADTFDTGMVLLEHDCHRPLLFSSDLCYSLMSLQR